MSAGRINLNRTVYELCSENQNLPEILAEIGFKDIIKPGMISTVGRFMTIPKGAAVKKIDMGQVKQTLIDHGFEIEEK